MGAEQSSAREAGSNDGAPKATCYYELLGVERTATDEEIRRAYKKKALELHPDRNFGDVENATRRFAEVQTAYEVLSDPQERAWYDSHRDAILRGDTGAADSGPAEFNNVRLTTTEDIYALIGRFNSRVPFNDSPSGFFGILSETFDSLAQQEVAACEWEGKEPPEYPPFGSSTDDYETVVRPFYNRWMGFATQKTFSWKDTYRPSTAEDRRMRRAMEAANKKAREDAIRNFNEAVRSLVAFVRKRDPRYVASMKSEAEREKALREAAAAQAARSRAANKEKMANAFVADWAKSRDEAPEESEFSESDASSEIKLVECIICNKTFKSEKQFEAHEKSKKHQKLFQQVRRQMLKDDAEFRKYEESRSAPTPKDPTNDDMWSISGDDMAQPSSTDGNEGSKQAPAEGAKQPPAKDGAGARDEKVKSADSAETESSSDDDDYAPRAQVENRILNGKEAGSTADAPSPDEDLAAAGKGLDEMSIQDGASAPKKVGKAKAKREKKAAKAAASAAQNICLHCQQPFESRTKMFNHIREEHEMAQKGVKGSKKGKR